MSKLKVYGISILIPLIAGAVIGLLTMSGSDFEVLSKPALSPPGILFPIVWSILYTLMGISYGMLVQKGKDSIEARFIYFFQLGVNLLWSVFFFSLKWRLFSFIWILLLLLSVAAMIYVFYKRYKPSGLLQIPYLGWVAFASYLNLGIYILNR